MQAAKRKVLIVEDEFILYNELADFFTEKGYSIIGNDDGTAVDNYDDAVALLRDNEPHIAVLDIQIKGRRDGLELAAFIKEHFYSLVIILTAYDNHENLDRASLLGPDGFVIKAEKPLNKKQLWASIMVQLPKLNMGILRKRQGSLFKVREVDTTKLNDRSGAASKHEYDPLDLETFIKWEVITHIVSYNSKTAGEGNNNILFYTTLHHKGYINRSTLSEIELQLPAYFIRTDQSCIVNFNHVTSKGKGNRLYFIDDLTFKLSDKYKDAALDKINLILGNKFK